MASVAWPILAGVAAVLIACGPLAPPQRRVPGADAFRGGAPRDGDRFANPGGPRPAAGMLIKLPFFLRRTWTTLAGRAGAAPVVPYDRAALGQDPSVTWIGHSTMLVRMDGATFLTDPMFSDRASPVPFLGPKRLVPPGVPIDDLPAIDFATLSHDHYDHTDLPSIARLAERGVVFVAGLGMGDLVRSVGGEVIELDWWQSVRLGDVTVHCVPAQHFSGRSIVGRRRRLWAGWVVVGRTRRFYHAGDTGYFDGFRIIRERLGPIDLAAIPIGAYRPSEMMRFVHLDPDEAVRAMIEVGARTAIGMHWGTFDLADEPLDEPPRRFHAAANRAGVGADRVWTLAVGETRRW